MFQNEMTSHDLYQACQKIVIEAGAIIETEKKREYKIIRKSRKELVTEMDLIVQSYLSEALGAINDCDIFYEEDKSQGNKILLKECFIIDPIDATHNLVAGLPFYNLSIGYVKDDGGDENIHFFAVNIDGTNEIDLTPFENVQTRMIDDLEDDPDHIILGLNKRDPRIHDAFKVNVTDGTMKLIAENPGNISGWMTDHDGNLRVAITSDGVNTSLLYRDSESESFKTILTTDFKVRVDPLFFTFDNKNR
jgi:hypothetical protein